MFTPFAVASQANTKKYGSPGPGHVSGVGSVLSRVKQSRGTSREGIIHIIIIISDSFAIMLFTFGLVSFRSLSGQSPVLVAGLNSAASFSGARFCAQRMVLEYSAVLEDRTWRPTSLPRGLASDSFAWRPRDGPRPRRSCPPGSRARAD